MMENHRSGKIWESFMKNPEISPALTSIGFVTDPYSTENEQFEKKAALQVFPNPSHNKLTVRYLATQKELGTLKIWDMYGLLMYQTPLADHTLGWNELELADLGLPSGFYTLEVTKGQSQQIVKILLTNK
jgi:hypothetical protein